MQLVLSELGLHAHQKSAFWQCYRQTFTCAFTFLSNHNNTIGLLSDG